MADTKTTLLTELSNMRDSLSELWKERRKLLSDYMDAEEVRILRSIDGAIETLTERHDKLERLIDLMDA